MLDSLIEDIEERRLFARVSELLQAPAGSVSAADRATLLALQSARRHILEDIMTAADEISRVLRSKAIAHRIDRESLRARPPQYQQLDLEIDRRDLGSVVDILETLGYRCPVTRGGAGWAAFMHTRDKLLLTHTDAATTRVRICWQTLVRGMPRLAFRAEAITRFDWPPWTWPLALMLERLQRLPAKLAGSRHDLGRSALGEWLGTPKSLLPELMRFAAVEAADVVADLGCGDGRVLIHAASTTGCSALGIEREADLCRLARAAVDRAGLDDRVSILHGDAATLDLATVTCIFLFLPIDNLDPLIALLKSKLKPGARIVAHEHTAYRGEFPPDEKRLLVGERAFTVGYLWRVPG